MAEPTQADDRLARSDHVYLKDLVARCLADRGLPGRVDIRPRTPFAVRVETGERTQFVVEYHGDGTARLVLEEWDISCGTVGAPVAVTLADRIVRSRVDIARDRAGGADQKLAISGRPMSAGATGVLGPPPHA